MGEGERKGGERKKGEGKKRKERWSWTSPPSVKIPADSLSRVNCNKM